MSTTDLTAARLRRPGPNGARVLLVAGRTWLEGGGAPDNHRVPVRLLDRLWLSARRGVELDVVCDVGRVLRILESFAEAWDVAAYDSVVILPDPGRPPLPPRLQRVIDRLAVVTRVVSVTDAPGRAQPFTAPMSARAGRQELRVVAQSGELPAALVADAVGGALLGLLDPAAGRRALEARKPDSLADHLQRVAVAASAAFAVGSAAIAVLTGGHARTLAAVGRALADPACVRAAAVRPVVVLDLWQEARLARDARPEADVRFFAAHPLELVGGAAMGALTVFDSEPRTADEFDPEILRDLAMLASAELQYAGATA